MRNEILQKIYSNELETCAFFKELVDHFETARDRSDLCNRIVYMFNELREQKDRSGKTLELIGDLLLEGLT